jgi:hypothetical protein
MLLGELLIDHRKWLRYQLQWLPFGRYAKARGDGRRPNHQRCAKQVTAKYTPTGACIDQRPEKPGAGNAADACADSIEESNGKRPNLDREGLADREIGGTRSSRGEEEDYNPLDRLANSRKRADGK